MAKIVINEVSKNYSWSIGAASYATVALPITASWGPGFFDPDTLGMTLEDTLERTSWARYPANQEGVEAFAAAYRGPASNYRITKDYSYQMAMTLLAAGYDVLVCRMCPGAKAISSMPVGDATLHITAKYPGTFGNNLIVSLKKVLHRNYWNMIVYVKDASTGVTTAVENKIFYFDLNNPQETILHLSEMESRFVDLTVEGSISDEMTSFEPCKVTLAGGTDKADITGKTSADLLNAVKTLATSRLAAIGCNADVIKNHDYIAAVDAAIKNVADIDVADAATMLYKEWLFRYVLDVYDLLKDKLTYNPNRIISPGWDDMNTTDIDGVIVSRLNQLSPIHCKIMEVCYYSRCATGYLDIPKCLPRNAVYNESTIAGEEGYAQMLARPEDFAPNFANISADDELNASLYPTHCALFAPWGQYTYVNTGKQAPANPAFLALMIERAMIKNQSLQYEWCLPTNRKHNLAIGKLDYTVSKKLLDEWQKLEGVGVNVITAIPDMGTTVWGNSTLFETPPATYQALANLSTRKLMNAVKDLVYRCGIAITFQYSNNEAYASFVAGCTPLLDTMKNVGAIEGYKIRMSADVSGLDRVNLNTVIGTVELFVHGVINDIIVDLVALPAGLNQ